MNANELAHALIARGHLTEEAAVRGDLLVREVSRRHSSFVVTRRQGSSLFVKHARDERGEAAETLQREARLYWLDAQGHTPQLSALLPRFRDYDPSARTLVLDWISSSGTLADALRRGALGTREAASLGTALATIQTASSDSALLRSLLPRRKPWILSLHRAALDNLSPITGGQRELLQRVSELPTLSAILDGVQGGWRFETLVHGDLKLDNCLLEAVSGNAEPSVRIVDWELVDLGDPAWDAATVLQCWLSHGMLSGLVSGSFAPTSEAGYDYLVGARRAANSFFGAYVAGCPRLHSGQLPLELSYLQAHVAARLVVTAYEALHQLPTLTPPVAQLLAAAHELASVPGQLAAVLALETC